MRRLVWGFFVLTALVWGQNSPAGPKANPADVGSLDAIVKAVYDVISGPAGQKRDWDRMRSLFIPDARLIPTRVTPESVQARALTLEQYIERASGNFEKNGFFESEISRKTEEFGSIAHVFSTYESRRSPREAPFSRGINSIQLMKDKGRWWVVTIYWDAERPDSPIPAKYLPQKQVAQYR